MTPLYAVEPLGKQHDRSNFSCGVEALDSYLATQATQDIRRRVSGCFVAVSAAPNEIAGYYTMAATSMPLSDVAVETARKLPRYPLVPGVRIGRLAVARAHQGKGLGAALLLDVIERSLRSDIAVFAVVVDAKDDTSAAFYRHHGFEVFANVPGSLYLPLAEAMRRLGMN